MQDNERIIELIAQALDEPLNAQEQALVNEAIQNSLPLRVAAEGLREFDALLKRTGMAIPEEGFPARFLARLEAYEKSRTRAYPTLPSMMMVPVAASGPSVPGTFTPSAVDVAAWEDKARQAQSQNETPPLETKTELPPSDSEPKPEA